jgi:hypothetical protein
LSLQSARGRIKAQMTRRFAEPPHTDFETFLHPSQQQTKAFSKIRIGKDKSRQRFLTRRAA